MYDYLIVGAGLFGAALANRLTKAGSKCLIIEKRNHIGGNAYTCEQNGIHVHKYGAHIFHTDNKIVWEYVNSFAEFLPFINSPLANYKGEIYNLPFNMNTFYALWKIKTPRQAKEKIEQERQKTGITNPTNLEEQGLFLLGEELYNKLIKGYTEKQWGKSAKELPPEILNRVPLRFTYDNNYFNDKYQGIPSGGYTKMIDNMLKGIEVELNIDFLLHKNKLQNIAKTIIYTGAIDEYYQYCFGELEYRSLRFEEETLQSVDFQGNAVVNYTDSETPFTRIIEHKHFGKIYTANTIITKEYPAPWRAGQEPFYPVNDKKNQEILNKYIQKSKGETNVIFGGRLGTYRYLDMDDVIFSALELAKKLI